MSKKKKKKSYQDIKYQKQRMRNVHKRPPGTIIRRKNRRPDIDKQEHPVDAEKTAFYSEYDIGSDDYFQDLIAQILDLKKALPVPKVHKKYSPDKKSRGRPTKYDPIHLIPYILQKSAEGASMEELVLYTGLTYDTLKRWMTKYPEFYEAMKVSQALAKAWWLKQGRLNIYNKTFNESLWMKNMANRYGWKNQHQVDFFGIARVEDVEKKELEITINAEEIKTPERKARVIEILAEAGALRPGTEQLARAEVDRLHTDDPDT